MRRGRVVGVAAGFGLAAVAAALASCGVPRNGMGAPAGPDAETNDASAGPDVTLSDGAGSKPDSGIPVADAASDVQGQEDAPHDAPAEAPLEASADASKDGSAGGPDTGCAGVICNGQCTTAEDCRGCAGAPLFCASTGSCAASCAGCRDQTGAPRPIQCFACDVNLANPIGTCEYDDAGSYCLNGDYVGRYLGDAGYQCACGDASDCPGATQVCVALGNHGSTFCLTCGETTLATIQGQPCKDGGSCQAASAACQ